MRFPRPQDEEISLADCSRELEKIDFNLTLVTPLETYMGWGSVNHGRACFLLGLLLFWNTLNDVWAVKSI